MMWKKYIIFEILDMLHIINSCHLVYQLIMGAFQVKNLNAIYPGKFFHNTVSLLLYFHK